MPLYTRCFKVLDELQVAVVLDQVYLPHRWGVRSPGLQNTLEVIVNEAGSTGPRVLCAEESCLTEQASVTCEHFCQIFDLLIMVEAECFHQRHAMAAWSLGSFIGPVPPGGPCKNLLEWHLTANGIFSAFHLNN